MKTLLNTIRRQLKSQRLNKERRSWSCTRPEIQTLEPRLLMSGTHIPGLHTNGTLLQNQTLGAGVDWHIESDVRVPIGVTLTIEPGAIVDFSEDAKLRIEGRLHAVGTEAQPIEMQLLEGESGGWAGLEFVGTRQDNQLVHVNIDAASGGSHAIDLLNANLNIDHVTWTGTNDTILELNGSNATVSNSVFPTISNSETVHGTNLPGNGYLVFDSNIFGGTTGYSDVIDFTGGKRPGAVIELYNNVFTGGSDDVLDLDGTDAHIEGNYFINIHQDAPRSSSSNAIATGRNGSIPSDITVVRNYFYDVDHALLLKENSSAIFHNNTVIGSTIAAINFDEPDRGVDPGAGIDMEGNIFWNNAAVFANQFQTDGDPDPVIDANLNIISSMFHNLGAGNLDVNPQLMIDEINRIFTLLPGSPAIGTGPNGINMGADVPQWVSVSGLESTDTDSDVSLTIDGPGIVNYRYSLNGAPFSGPVPIDTPLQFNGLADGQHTVRVIGINSAGRVQPTEDAALVEFNVNSTLPHIRINEILSANNGSFDHEGTNPDYIELYNAGGAPMNLAGMSISDDPLLPLQYVFPANTIVQPGEYLTLLADDDTETSGIHLGFSLSSSGDAVYLFDTPLNGSAIVDSVEFGSQIEDMSNGRLGLDGTWDLNTPTPGELNTIAPHVGGEHIQINEFLAASNVSFDEDFIELLNPTSLPMGIGEFHLTDDPDDAPDLFQIKPLTYMMPGEFLVYIADDTEDEGHLPFKLSSDDGSIAVFDPSLNLVTRVDYLEQQTDLSMGLSPDGEGEIELMVFPTPGQPNVSADMDATITEAIRFFEKESQWHYLDEITNGNVGTPLEDYPTDAEGDAWNAVDFDTTTSDASIGTWKTADGVFGFGNLSDGAPDPTTILSGVDGQDNTVTTFLFRRTLSHPNASTITELELDMIIDDGLVLYVNGVEVERFNMDTGTVETDTFADGATNDEGYNDYLVDVTGLFVDGDNTIAVELHQANLGSSDIGFDMELDALVTIPLPPAGSNEAMLIDGLRITELMYNPATDGDAEYIEFTNISGNILDLSGVRINGAVDYTFDDGQMINPGEILLVVKDEVVFNTHYTGNINIVGEYDGSLSNSGEEVLLQLPNPFDAAILRFDYEEDWFLPTDGGGLSLNTANSFQDREDWDDVEGWTYSGLLNGTPGRLDPTIAALGGDANFDGVVNLEDLAILATFFGQTAEQPGDIIWEQGDFTGDGIVDLSDLAKLATFFGQSGSDGFPVDEAGQAASESPIRTAATQTVESPEGALLLNTGSSTSSDTDLSWGHISNLLDDSNDDSSLV